MLYYVGLLLGPRESTPVGCYDTRDESARAIFKCCVDQGYLDFDNTAKFVIDKRFAAEHDISQIWQTKHKRNWPFYYFKDNVQFTDIIYDYGGCPKTRTWSYKIYKVNLETSEVTEVD